jgi:hypothetical protein
MTPNASQYRSVRAHRAAAPLTGDGIVPPKNPEYQVFNTIVSAWAGTAAKPNVHATVAAIVNRSLPTPNIPRRPNRLAAHGAARLGRRTTNFVSSEKPSDMLAGEAHKCASFQPEQKRSRD